MSLLAFGNIASPNLRAHNPLHGLGARIPWIFPDCSFRIRDRFHSARRRTPAQSPPLPGAGSGQIVALLIRPEFVRWYEPSIRLLPLRCA